MSMAQPLETQPDPSEGPVECRADDGSLLDDPDFAREFVRRCPEAVYVSDPNDRIVDANREMVELFGARSRRHLQRLDPEDLFVDLEIIERRAELLRRQGVLRNFEYWIRRADGEVAPVLDTCWLRRNGDGRVLGVIGIMREAVDPAETTELRANDSRFLDPDTGAYRQRYLELQRHKLESARLKWGCLRIRLNDLEGGDPGHHGNGSERRRLRMRQLAEFVRKNARREALLFRLEETELVLVATINASGEEKVIARRMASKGRDESPVPFTIGVAYRRPTETVEKVLERTEPPKYTIPGP